jgi:anti-sigma regulatory factor (Ser/Thr protein kinase)
LTWRDACAVIQREAASGTPEDWRRSVAGTNEDGRSVERQLAANEDAPAHARALLRELADGLDERFAANLYLALSELVTNAVVHGHGDEILVRLRRGSRLIRMEVCDSGTTDFGWRDPPRASRLRAHGLEIVAAFTDRFGIDRTPQTLAWCELDLPS